MTDQPIPADFQMLVIEAMAEASRAMIKFPQPNYTISKFAEEAGEVVKAAIHHAEGREKRDAVVDEMRQALAMMLRLWIEGDQVHGMAPLCGTHTATPDPITADMIRELRRGVARIHAALADPTRPRQSCGEVAAWWLRYADACVSHLSPDSPAATLRGEPAAGAKAQEGRDGD